MRILLDIDGVVADLLPYWLELINRYYGERLLLDEITCWEVHKFCKNAKPEQIYSFFEEPGFFLHLDPVPGSLTAVNQLLATGHEIVFVTACNAGHSDKRRWVQRHFPNFNLENIVFAERKELIKGDIFVDDNVDNVRAYQLEHPGALAVCFAAPHNRDYAGLRIRNLQGLFILLANCQNQKGEI